MTDPPLSPDAVAVAARTAATERSAQVVGDALHELGQPVVVRLLVLLKIGAQRPGGAAIVQRSIELERVQVAQGGRQVALFDGLQTDEEDAGLPVRCLLAEGASLAIAPLGAEIGRRGDDDDAGRLAGRRHDFRRDSRIADQLVMIPPDIDVVADLAADFGLEIGHQRLTNPDCVPATG